MASYSMDGLQTSYDIMMELVDEPGMFYMIPFGVTDQERTILHSALCCRVPKYG